MIMRCRWMGLYINQKGNARFKTSRLPEQSASKKRLAPFGYYPAHQTPGLWLHKTRPIALSLIVDDFAVKYVGKEHAEHRKKRITPQL
jgi:hypothetical protein